MPPSVSLPKNIIARIAELAGGFHGWQKSCGGMRYNGEMPPASFPIQSWTEQELLRRVESSAEHVAVVTSTDRTARTLRQRYNQRQRTAGNSGWRTPQILAWEPWLKILWDQALLDNLETRVILTEIQELEIWRNILAEDKAARQIVAVDNLAGLAQKAWQQMHRYRIPLVRVRNDQTLDTASFYRWGAAFEKFSKKSSFLSASQMEEAIAQWISSPAMTLPQEIFLIGFDRVTPSQVLLSDALRKRGCDIRFVELIPPGARAAERAIACARTVDDEMEAAAHWVRRRLLEEPRQQIGVIVPSLETMRSSIDATFRRVLAPSTMDIRARNMKLPYEFSLGTPMQRMQPIRTALTMLRWLHRPLPAEEVSWLLVHGGFGDDFGSSRDARAALDRRFRERKFQLGGSIPFSAFRRWLSQQAETQGTAAFRQSMELFFLAAKRAGIDKARTFGEWREVVEDLLNAADWHLLSAGSSADYQLMRRWNALLNHLSSLNSVAGAVRFSAALEKLKHLAAHMLFTLQTSNVPVLILGVPESAGLVFDAVWWMNAQASAWPPRGKALPFLPWALQRESHMPYADPAEDYAFAARTTQRILQAAETVHVSFSLQESDLANASARVPDPEIALSPFVREYWPGVAIADVEPAAGENLTVESAFESISEEPAVPFRSDGAQAVEVRGGVSFLELQAACPFRAFAELRLGARPLETAGNGLSAGDQGSVLHRVLDEFWKAMQSRNNLLEKAPDEQQRILREHIDRALANFVQHAEEPWQKTILAVEADRLEERLLEWLEREKRRPEFTVIGTETSLDHPVLGGIAFNCRIDRIDRVEGGVALLDYKTGVVDRRSCEGDRPDLPQLPAYAVLRNRCAAADEPLAGLAFAGLHPRKMDFTVIGSLPSVFEAPVSATAETGDAAKVSRARSKFDPGKLSPQQMRDLEDTWSEVLTRLAEAFRAGVAIVDPKKHGETCRYCEQAMLCRVGETAGVLTDAEDRENSENISHGGPER